MAGDMAALLSDLRAESDDLDAILHGASAATLALPTPAQGWTVADTVGHLWFFDREGRRALEDPEAFVAGLDAVIADPDEFMAGHLEQIRSLEDSLLPAWQEERGLILAALHRTDPAARVPWYGPPMSPMSFATARLMETWAHGQDVADAIGATRRPTDRLQHIAHLGVRTRGFSYAIKGLQPPDQAVFVSLTAPDGSDWTWGDPDAVDRVTGPALDFCLLVTQRRVQSDLALTVTGAAANEWMSVAQAFAGAPSLTDESRAGL